MTELAESNPRLHNEGLQPVLSVDSLSVEYDTEAGPVRVLDGVSLSVEPGETVAVVGESGSGKSTLGLAVMGLLPAGRGRICSGTVRLRGQDITSMDESLGRKLRGERMSMIFQDPLSALNPVLTVGRQIREIFTHHRGIRRSQARAAAMELLRRVQIPDPDRRYRQFPQQFSGGMRQRVVIAMALALDPELVIADEPTTALDVTVQARIMGLLAQLTGRQGTGLLLITHDLAVVAGSADRVFVLYAGRVMEQGPIREVYEAPANPYTAGLLASVPTLSRIGAPLTPIPGTPPDPAARPAGCAFHPRCPMARDRCLQETPQPRLVAAGRYSACHFAEEVLHGSSTRP